MRTDKHLHKEQIKMGNQMDHTSPQRILFCMQKFCTDKVCFQGLTPDEQVAQFQSRTNHSLSEEMNKKSPDMNTVETLAANYTLVMTNALSEKCRVNKRLSFVTDEYDAELAKRAIDNQFKLSWKYKASEIVLKRNQKRRKILVMILISLVVTGLILFAFSNILKNDAAQIKAENKEQFFDWITGPLGMNQDREQKLAHAENLINMSGSLGIVGTVIFAILFAFIITAQRAIKASRKVLNDWEDYRYLCNYLEFSAKKAMEAKKLWQY